MVYFFFENSDNVIWHLYKNPKEFTPTVTPSPPLFLDRDIKEEAKNKENKGAIQVTHIMVTCVNEVVK